MYQNSERPTLRHPNMRDEETLKSPLAFIILNNAKSEVEPMPVLSSFLKKGNGFQRLRFVRILTLQLTFQQVEKNKYQYAFSF